MMLTETTESLPDKVLENIINNGGVKGGNTNRLVMLVQGTVEEESAEAISLTASF